MSQQYDNNFMWKTAASEVHFWLLHVLMGIITFLSGFMSSGLNISFLSTRYCDNCHVVAKGEVHFQIFCRSYTSVRDVCCVK